MEKDIEKKLKAEVEKRGGLCFKFLSSVSGIPDRLCLMPGGRAVFVELKDKGKKPRELQKRQMARIRARGFEVAVLDSQEAVLDFMRRFDDGACDKD